MSKNRLITSNPRDVPLPAPQEPAITKPVLPVPQRSAAGEYIDCGVSGSKDSRPALNRLMTDACARKFDVLLVWKLDRFGRSFRHLVNALAELEALGVAFVSLRDNLDLSTPAGRMLFHVIGAMAEFERSLIQERVKAGLRHARSKGKHLGRPKVVVDRSRIACLRAEGRGWKAIAREMKLGVGTVLRAAQQAGLLGSENLV